MEIFPGISMSPDVRDGKPCVSGTAIDVATIVGMLGTGKSFEDIEEIFQIDREQTYSALRYASYVTDHLPLRMPARERDQKTGGVKLVSESTKKIYKPIYISSDDDFMVNGKIIDVIKR